MARTASLASMDVGELLELRKRVDAALVQRRAQLENWSVSVEQLAQGFHGRRFGELVLYHVKRESVLQIIAALMHTRSLLPKPLHGLCEEWIDMNNQYGLNETFWRSDCGEVCLS